ncbi:MAG: hypothetical protein O3A84_12150 [Proteobacteria bacterium]|nr:hypothetical protein [Pseudomonadota bacterium]
MRYKVAYEDNSRKYLVLDCQHDQKPCAAYHGETAARERARQLNTAWQQKISDIAAI